MRGVEFLKTQTVTPGNTFSVPIAPGRYYGFFCVMYGTTDTGQTLTLADIGNLRLQRGGRQIQGRSWEFYSDLTDRLGGFPPLPTGSAATAERVGVIIPAYVPGLPNTLEIITDSELVLYVDPLVGMSTTFGANAITMEFYGLTNDEIPETYEAHYDTLDQTSTAASQQLNPNIQTPNVSHVIFDDTGADITSLQLTVDGKTVAARISDQVYTDLNQIEYRAEAAGNPLTIIPTADGSQLGSYVNATSQITIITAAAGTIPVTVLSVHRSPQGRSALSVQAVKSLRDRRAAQAAVNIIQFQ